MSSHTTFFMSNREISRVGLLPCQISPEGDLKYHSCSTMFKLMSFLAALLSRYHATSCIVTTGVFDCCGGGRGGFALSRGTGIPLGDLFHTRVSNPNLPFAFSTGSHGKPPKNERYRPECGGRLVFSAPNLAIRGQCSFTNNDLNFE
jgi:hypothetical protein